MVACGTSGLLGGRRVPPPLPVAANSLMPAFCFPAAGFLVGMVFSLKLIFTFYESVFTNHVPTL
jgi:hypothetical protein